MNVSPLNSANATSPAGQVQELTDIARAKAAKLTGAALRNASKAEQGAAVAAQFEAILVRQLLGKTMNSMLGGAQSGVAGSIYGDMLADTISQQLTAGHGLGLGRFLEQQFTPKGEGPGTKDEGQPTPGVGSHQSLVPGPSSLVRPNS